MLRRAGVTLIEMLIVVALLALMAGITFPSVTSGLDSIRLTSAADATASFLSAALNRANRRQQVIELTISRTEATLAMRSTDPGFTRELKLPDGIIVAAVHPEHPSTADAPRHFMFYPGGVVPRITVELVNRKHDRRIVQVDPVTGIPRIARSTQQQ
jgi:prepilin-type N-terminal cleavage/methylation domain-containing protein